MKVSIPFKRESVSKVDTPVDAERHFGQKFQFPSNGKAYPKCLNTDLSIESASPGFNSLQTGKRIQSLYRMHDTRPWDQEFQFPSNGKAYPKAIKVFYAHVVNQKFQFPSNGKAYPK